MKTKILTAAVLSTLLAFSGTAFAHTQNQNQGQTSLQGQGQGQGQLQIALQGQGQGQGQGQSQSQSSKSKNLNGNVNGNLNYNANYDSSTSSSYAKAVAIAVTPPQIAKAHAYSDVVQKGVVMGNSVNSAALKVASSGFFGGNPSASGSLTQVSSTGANSLSTTGLSGINAVAQTSGNNNSVNNSASGTFSISMVNSGISGAITH